MLRLGKSAHNRRGGGNGHQDGQLDLFKWEAPNHETFDAIRPPGREALAAILPEIGEGTGGGGPTAGDALAGRSENGRGIGLVVSAFHTERIDAAASARPGLGDGARALYLSAAGELAAADLAEPQPVLNQSNYRITQADRLGEGSLKRKCRDNLAAIELLKCLEDEGRAPTDDEKRLLVRYVGWGGLPQVFDRWNEAWTAERQRLEQLLTEEELESARATTLNAHYTCPLIIRAIYAMLARLGFESGRILEPACGLGHFIGLMPDDMHGRSRITAIEIDSITTRLARLLYPDADIRHQPFEEARLADGFFDVAVGNIPFGDYKPYDPQLKQWNFLVHDYFFAKTLAKVRAGGLILFITSRGTLDKMDGALREYVAQQADLLGAIRLPNIAFKRNANTEVTTDIVILRKRPPGQSPDGPAWREVGEMTNSIGETIPVNEYFLAHPEMMLGEMRLAGRMYKYADPTLVPNGRDLGEQLAEATALLPRGVFRPQDTAIPLPTLDQTFPSPDHIKPNAYALVNERIGIREDGHIRILEGLPLQRAQRIRGLIRLRDAVRRCLRSQVEATDESDMEALRHQLNQTYDRFIARFGPVSQRANTSAFRGDPDLPLLLSLEHYDEETQRATKAPIFRERTVQARKLIPELKNAQDALLITLGERGCVDLDFIASLLHRKPSECVADLKGAIFLNPQTNRWETEDEYLSGNVRAKLAVAEAAALADQHFRENVEVLKLVQPADLAASEIDVRLGSTWIPADDVRQFAQELLGEDQISVSHAPQLGLWVVRGGYGARFSVANTTEWGTDRRSALELLEDALNLRTPTVYDHDPDTDRDIINAPATEAARDKQEKIKEQFKQWIWRNDERRERLTRKYNDEFNNVRLRTFNGEHLALPGASPTISLHPHQRAAVWRILQTPNCLLAHVVGAGKTYTMVAAAMELKRLGFARKPLFAVPNHMLGQFSSELLTLYPAANILVATKDDFERNKRKTLMSRIATGNWDAIIVTHSGFEKISVSSRTQEEFIKSELRELQLAIEQQRQEDNSRIIKSLERAKKRLETKLKGLAATEKKDDGLTFEELGVDRLFVDEAHYFKNLFYVSKMTRIAGLPQTASQRAFDMFLKVLYVQRLNGGGGVVFATGTPIANSVAEMFTMQRYLQLTALKTLHVDHFDSWAATFGEPVTAMELAPDGSGYRLNTRFARFINVPELMQQFRQVADVQTPAMLKLPVPDLRNGTPTVISAPCSKELKIIVQSLVERAEALRTGRVDPREDNMLLVTTDGRKAALDLRLHDPHLPDHPDSKINLAVTEIERIWRESAADRSTQLVFCDLSIPTGGKGFSVYEDMRNKLVVAGIPPSEIEFIQDHDSDAAKLQLFRQVRAGKVRILFGSTQKMGTGANVQERLVALHHLDAPWRPADVEQREGRILRQGNLNPEVQVYRYVTEESFDAYMWQTLETKAKFIAQVMTGESDLRRIEDIDGIVLTYAEVKAIASGNPLVIEKARIDAELARLSRLHCEHQETQFKLRTRVRHLTEELPRLEQRREAMKRDIAARQDTSGDQFVMVVDGQDIRDRGIAGEFLLRRAERVRGTRKECLAGTIAGFQVYVADNFIQGPEIILKGATHYAAKVTDTAHGTIRSVEHTIQHFEDAAESLARAIGDTRKRLSETHAQVDARFEYAERLAELAKRQQEIEDALDLTKNRAPSQLDARGTDEVPSDLIEDEAPTRA
ncbi:MAG TPA: DEAD/DEAH box helicase family protein [Candidatus Paceibacterota bacterium]|nr:DEAD/DEAH box helicase family protein [Candidatus Paceibacterota bacterium]